MIIIYRFNNVNHLAKNYLYNILFFVASFAISGAVTSRFFFACNNNQQSLIASVEHRIVWTPSFTSW